ncbi:TOBE domain-containing protein [Comamonas endophytica]|uniref:TOBE domain-containing protein n=1 Tax=Comamonas endophytica TaxID=2949090 RepID=UPI00360FC02A
MGLGHAGLLHAGHARGRAVRRRRRAAARHAPCRRRLADGAGPVAGHAAALSERCRRRGAGAPRAAGPGPRGLPARVLECKFRGSHLVYSLQLPCGERLLAQSTLAQVHAPAETVFVQLAV